MQLIEGQQVRLSFQPSVAAPEQLQPVQPLPCETLFRTKGGPLGPMFAAIHTDSEQLFRKEMVWFSYAMAAGAAIPSGAFNKGELLVSLHAQSAAVIPPRNNIPRISPMAIFRCNLKRIPVSQVDFSFLNDTG